MNLNSNPTIDQLRELVRGRDDYAGNHVLWVKKTGEVEISTIPLDQGPTEFEACHPDMQIRLETFLAGNEYVGPDAANDAAWISELFDRLVQAWPVARCKSTIELRVGIEGMDEEQVSLGSSAEFWKMIEERRAEPMMARAELERRLGDAQLHDDERRQTPIARRDNGN